MKKILLAGFLICTSIYTWAQTNADELTGTQVLRSARAIYDQGRLHELPGIIETALKRRGKNQLSKSEKIEAYKLLILTYIYLEEPQKADNNMIALLKTDPFFELIDSDPIEFRNQYKKFRSNSLFRIGAKFGVNQTYQNVISNYYLFGETKGKGTYAPKLSLQYALVFEKDLKDKYANFVIAPELMMSTQAWTYSINELYFNDNRGITSSLTQDITQQRIQLNALVQYKFINKATKARNSANIEFYPYISIGPSLAYLSKSSYKAVKNDDTRDVNTSPSYDDLNKYNSLAFFLIGSAGIRYKIGSLYIHADVRYQYSFDNIINTKNRYVLDTKEEREMALLYGFVRNDLSLNQGMINVGLSRPIFSPKKLIK